VRAEPASPTRAPAALDRWILYERCVQSPADAIALLVAAHGGEPAVLAEDFAGSAAISRAWVGRSPRARAIATDLDPDALARAGGVERLEPVLRDVRDRSLLELGPADVVHAGNFSIGELRTRADLLAYLALARRRLAPGGILACDTYGGPSAFERGLWARERYLDDGSRCVSTWEHRAADPATAAVENALHFRVDRGGELVLALHDAFVYRWRLWGIAELADALAETGFARPELFAGLERPIASGAELAGDHVVCLVARRA
jgi:SAM-dependent methyltransferase